VGDADVQVGAAGDWAGYRLVVVAFYVGIVYAGEFY
jgi:hypothetical protein